MHIINSIRTSKSWRIIGNAFGAMTAIAVVFGLYSDISSYINLPAKELEIVILADSNLLSVDSSISQDIKIQYRDEEVSNLSLIQLKIESIGNIPILPDDYARPISFNFPNGSEIIEAVVQDQAPDDIGLNIEVNGNKAVLSRELLNPNDKAILRFLVANLPQNVSSNLSISLRIAGMLNPVEIKQAIDDASSPQPWFNWLTTCVVLQGALGVFAYFAWGILRTLAERSDAEASWDPDGLIR